MPSTREQAARRTAILVTLWAWGEGTDPECLFLKFLNSKSEDERWESFTKARENLITGITDLLLDRAKFISRDASGKEIEYKEDEYPIAVGPVTYHKVDN